MVSLVIAIIIILAIVVAALRRNKRSKTVVLPDNTKQLLADNVDFYNKLSEANKLVFENRVRDFLATTAVTGVETEVSELDRLLVASSAIIPIFAFPDWRYKNISEVLLYKGTFNKAYETEGNDRNVLGMVGDGAMHGQMILSQESLRTGFSGNHGSHNTAIHEFAHLIDKADGAVDGVPEYLLNQAHAKPWLQYMHETISKMRASGHSDINLYGATNEAEFFAVVSEYFFEQPDKLQTHHPELYAMLQEMFQPPKEEI